MQLQHNKDNYDTPPPIYIIKHEIHNAQHYTLLFGKLLMNYAEALKAGILNVCFRILIYRFISENLAEHINANMRECGEIDFDYTHLSDEEIIKDNDIKENIINQKGFFIMPSELFINVLQTHKSDTTNLNATLSNVFRNIESSSIDTKSENDFKGLFNDIDVNSSANLGERSLIKRNERLYKVMKEISKLDLDYSDNAIDAFDDAYVCR